MKHRRDLDDAAPEAVHDSIAAVDDLAERLVTSLAYYPSGQRVRFESPHRRDDPFHDEVGVVRGVARHIGADRFDVLGVPRRSGSPEKPALRLGVIYALAGVQFRQPTLYLRQEDEPLYSVLKRRIRWQLLDCLQSLLFGSTP